MSDLVQPEEMFKPPVTKEIAVRLIKHLYGFTAKDVKQFVSYDDKNFYFKANSIYDNSHVASLCEEGYLLKVTNSQDSESPDFFDAQNLMILHLAKAGMVMPEPIRNKSGDLKSIENMTVEFSEEQKLNNTDDDPPKKGFLVRVLKFVPGKILYNIHPWTTDHLHQCGKFLGKMDKELESFDHKGLEARDSIWFLSNAPKVKEYIYAVPNEDHKTLVTSIFDTFLNEVEPVKDQLASGTIHGDFNEQNILMLEREKGSGKYDVHTAIDFGDSCKNPLIYELAITIMYMMTKCTMFHPNMAGAHVIAGYQTVRKITELEMSLLRTLVASRYAQSLTMGAYSYSQDPGNEYLLCTAKNGWNILTEFWNMPPKELYREWNKIISSYQ
jgi:hydroxylysine kinase